MVAVNTAAPAEREMARVAVKTNARARWRGISGRLPGYPKNKKTNYDDAVDNSSAADMMPHDDSMSWPGIWQVIEIAQRFLM